MHEIQPFTFAMSQKEFFDGGHIRLGLKHRQCVHAKNGVVQIALAIAIAKPAVGILLGSEKIADEFGGFPEGLGCHAGDLQHFEPQAH